MSPTTRHFVLIEDNPLDIDLIQRAFARQGQAQALQVVASCPQARQLFAQWQNQEALPALILLDINLHGESGLDLLEELRAQPLTEHIPVVVLSSSQEHCDIERAYRSGVNAYLQKPMEFAELRSLLAEIASFWGQHNITCH